MPETPYAFISYRRSDAQQAALGLYFQRRLRFGSSKIFMDVGAIGPGDAWPTRLQTALKRANVVIVLIGPNWLTAADVYGRRRLDQADDWVRREIDAALDADKHVLPLLIGGMRQPPPRDALPEPLRRLFDKQALELRDEHWEDDIIAHLVKALIESHGFVEADAEVMLPRPEIKIPELTPEELDNALRSLPGWEPVESYIPRDYPRSRHELRRPFVFKSFPKAIAFMSSLVETVKKARHHPRLENQWRTVVVHLSTWDIGQKISERDVAMAHQIDALYEAQREGR